MRAASDFDEMEVADAGGKSNETERLIIPKKSFSCDATQEFAQNSRIPSGKPAAL